MTSILIQVIITTIKENIQHQKGRLENKVKKKTCNFRNHFLEQHKYKTVGYIWKEFKKHIMSIMNKRIPFKSASIRHNPLWMTGLAVKMIKKKQTL